MKISYDAQVSALYVTLADGRVARTVALDDGTNADEDAGGKLLGIEVLNPGRAWPLAQILRDYEVSGDNAHMLMSGYPFACSVKVA